MGGDQASSISSGPQLKPSILDRSYSSWSFLWSSSPNPAWVPWLTDQGQASSRLLWLPNDLVELHQTSWIFPSIRMSLSSLIPFLAKFLLNSFLLAEQSATLCWKSFTSMFLGVSFLLRISFLSQTGLLSYNPWLCIGDDVFAIDLKINSFLFCMVLIILFAYCGPFFWMVRMKF